MTELLGLAFRYWAPHKASGRLPIVVLHGLLGCHKNFVGFGRTFSALGYPVLCFDARNHGASFDSAIMDYPAMAQDLENLLAELQKRSYGGQDWRRVFVLGHSMGSRTAFMHALTCAQRVAALVALDVVPSPQNPDPTIPHVISAMRRAEGAVARKQAETRLRSELKAVGIDSDLLCQFLLLCNFPRNPVQHTGAQRWNCNLAAIEACLSQLLCWPAQSLKKNPNLPVLLIAGANSPYVKPQGWKLLQEYFPRAKKKLLPGVGHWPHSEAPHEFQNLVARFLEALVPSCQNS